MYLCLRLLSQHVCCDTCNTSESEASQCVCLAPSRSLFCVQQHKCNSSCSAPKQEVRHLSASCRVCKFLLHLFCSHKQIKDWRIMHLRFLFVHNEKLHLTVQYMSVWVFPVCLHTHTGLSFWSCHTFKSKYDFKLINGASENRNKIGMPLNLNAYEVEADQIYTAV